MEIKGLVPTVCLNMIVKNESRVIERMLASVAPYIDFYVICDTGSTDDTEALIENFFQTHFPRITGVVVHKPFRDFGYNRSYALHACQRHFPEADYLLLMDADMVLHSDIHLDPTVFKNGLQEREADVFLLFQGSDHFFTKNPRICRNRTEYVYKGVTHEYLSYPENAKMITMERSVLSILDVGDGGSKADKFQRDIRLLEEGLEVEPNNGRYLFYLGNSYKDCGHNEKAIEVYQRRIQLGGWHEETWICYYNIGCCFQHLGNRTKALEYWLDAYEIIPTRLENLYKIVEQYRMMEKYKLAFFFYDMAKRILHDNPHYDFLFTQRDVYEWRLDLEYTIFGYYVTDLIQPHHLTYIHPLPIICMNLLTKQSVYDNYDCFRNILQNYKFLQIPFTCSNKWTVPVPPLNSLLPETTELTIDHFTNSTPSLVRHVGKILLNVRFVNYRIEENTGVYLNQSKIYSLNFLLSDCKKKEEEKVVQTDRSCLGKEKMYPSSSSTWKEIVYDTTEDDYYVGLEDIRLFSWNGILFFNANRCLKNGEGMRVEHGTIDPETGHVLTSRLLKSPTNRYTEKNWVMFSRGNEEEPRMVYEWSPLTIGGLNPVAQDEFVVTHKQVNVPAFFKEVRCSTNGVYMSSTDEIWFLCHLVSYEDRRRFYYHLFIVLDARTYRLKKWSSLATFQRFESVEYTLGMVLHKDEKSFTVGLSTMDRTTEMYEISVADLVFHEQPV